MAFAALALRQALPGQRGREAHRRTGWWLTAAGVFNAAWVLLFTQRAVLAAQVVIVTLLVVLAIAALRLPPARGWGDRLLLHTPVTLYTGWVAVATVAGAATTSASFGAAPSALSSVAAVVLTAAAAVAAALRLPAVAGFAAAVCWALAWIAANTADGTVRAAAVVAVVAVAAAVVVMVSRRRDTAASAWG